MVTSGRLSKPTERLAEMLGTLGKQAALGSALSTRNQVPGEFRSPYRFPTGLERDVPRVFTFEDDPIHIDTRHIPPSLVMYSLAEAILRDDIRMVQSIHRGESKIIVLVDLSRSILSGCFLGDDISSLSSPGGSKLQSLYFAASAYLRIAEATGFVVRVVFLHGSTPYQQPRLALRNYAQQVLFSMGQRLVDSHDRAEKSPESREPFLLRAGLNLALAVRHRSVVVVLSDFLDPLDDYLATLAQALARHYVVLVDLATDHDREFPLPGIFDFGATRTRCRDGARHLEDGTEERILDPDTIAVWNRARQADRTRLGSLVQRFNGRFTRCRNQSYETCFAQALEIFQRIR